ncbi:DUF6731 family protein [Rummeliibacillus sp. TYF-LIM-RU47]|uniref:DUF6731 family protein n=1 Tax=Rummeliibacillus sp. TYF-LIM-RU47 TaxID=2608406 RepID=UPI001239B810|nr:DUF6731 family protein [Rummeliibacillus sp. TYF-LIM-RU47]
MVNNTIIIDEQDQLEEQQEQLKLQESSNEKATKTKLRSKEIGFNYFFIVGKKEDGSESRVGIKTILEAIYNNYSTNKGSSTFEKLVYEYNGEFVRLGDISVDNLGYYHLVFDRLIDYHLPVKTTLHGKSDVITILDNEYVGHQVSVLYDTNKKVLMIQRNRDSLSPTALGGVIRTWMEEFDVEEETSLQVIMDKTAKRRGKEKTQFRKMSVRTTGEAAKHILEKVTGKNDSNNEIRYVEITIASQPIKKSHIPEDVSDSILERYIDSSDVEKFHIHGKDDEDSRVEKIDLLDQKLESYLKFTFGKEKHLNPISVFSEMVNEYEKMKSKI